MPFWNKIVPLACSARTSYTKVHVEHAAYLPI